MGRAGHEGKEGNKESDIVNICSRTFVFSRQAFLSFSSTTILIHIFCPFYQIYGSPKHILKFWKHYKNAVVQTSTQIYALGICIFSKLPGKFNIFLAPNIGLGIQGHTCLPDSDVFSYCFWIKSISWGPVEA